MDWLDPVMLGRIQFTLTAAYHFIFVPLSIGMGLIMAIFVTRAYRSGTAKDDAAARFWVKLFTVTFAVGVATGITMEFSFGTNWADYSRFVGDIFGAPLAAEALLAFFLESVFLGVLLFGRNRVSKKFYLASAWLVWFGSGLSALWILIANSWMQTPAGAELAADGSRAVITDFFAAAFNPTTVVRYGHTVSSLIVLGAFAAMAIGGYYLLKKRHQDFAKRVIKVGGIVGACATVVLLVFAHSSAVQVAVEQPTKLAMMEGMYDSEVPSLYALGWVDEANQETVGLGIPGGTSFLIDGTWDTEYPGLNQLAQTEKYADLDVSSLPVNVVFQSYHLMVIMFGLIVLTLILVFIFMRGGKIQNKRWLQRLLFVSPLFPLIAIMTGWVTAEIGRQPWVVYPSTSGPDGVSLLTSEAISQSVSSAEVLITIVLFTLIYLLIFIAYVRIVASFIKKGPDDGEAVPASASAAGASTVAAKATAAAAKDGE